MFWPLEAAACRWFLPLPTQEREPWLSTPWEMVEALLGKNLDRVELRAMDPARDPLWVTIAELEEPHATQGLEVLRLMVVGSSDSDQAIKATSHSPHLPISARLAVTREKRGRRQWHPTPVLLPGKSHGWRSLEGCSPWGRAESDGLSHFTFTFHFHALEKEMATHSGVLAWRNPGTGEPGRLLSMGSHRVGHD